MSKVLKKDWRDLIIGVFDLETTGLNPAKDRIVEFGLVRFKGGKPIDSYVKLMGSSVKISKGAEKANGISNEDIKGKKTFDDYSIKIFKKLKKCDVLCAYNEQFDRSFLTTGFKKNHLSFPKRYVIDPLIISRFLSPTARSHDLDSVMQLTRTMPDRRDLKKLKIKAKRHRADYDSYVTGLVLYKLSFLLPKNLNELLYVQDWMYRYWLLKYKNNNKKYSLYLEPTKP